MSFLYLPSQTWWEVELTKNYENLALMLLEMCPGECISANFTNQQKILRIFWFLISKWGWKPWILFLGHFTDSKNLGCIKAMRKAVPYSHSYLDNGQIEIIFYTCLHTTESIYYFERVINYWIEKLNSALESGYSGLRLSENVYWLKKGFELFCWLWGMKK